MLWLASCFWTWDSHLGKLGRFSDKQAGNNWREFVLGAVTGSAKRAHGFVKADGNQGIATIDSKGQLGIGPRLAEEAASWASVWQGELGTHCPNKAYTEAKELLGEEIKNTTQLGWDQIDDLLSPGNLKATADSFPGSTSTGCDHAKMTWLSSLPECIWQDLSAIARKVTRLARGPSQVRPVLLFIFSKKGGGFRTIGVISSFMRVVMRALSPLLRKYDGLHSDPTDSATSGAGGAEYAAFWPRLLAR